MSARGVVDSFLFQAMPVVSPRVWPIGSVFGLLLGNRFCSLMSQKSQVVAGSCCFGDDGLGDRSAPSLQSLGFLLLFHMHFPLALLELCGFAGL